MTAWKAWPDVLHRSALFVNGDALTVHIGLRWNRRWPLRPKVEVVCMTPEQAREFVKTVLEEAERIEVGA